MPDPVFLPDAPLLRAPDAPPLQRQLHQRLRQAVLDGRLAPGSRLPGTRSLAEALGVSRNTVTAAYEQLAAEGFVQPDRQGTQVAALRRPPVPLQPLARPALAQRLAGLQPALPRPEPLAALRPGVPALAQFPAAAWRRALDRAARLGGPAALDYGDPAGEPALRSAIARHLGIARGVRCTADAVLITAGAQEALALCVQLLANPGERAWIEDPGYRGAQAAFQAGQLRVLPCRVDAQGLVASARAWRTQTPRLVYTTPSHQYPGGGVLTVARRLALIAAARAHGAWIIEDDYDSEFRHAGEPLGAMQGLVADAPVLYLGTFSKTMFPALRIGFLVLPATLHASVRTALAQLARPSPRQTQLALADFIESGQFSRHLGRMRRLYRERQQALRAALQRHLRVPHRIEGGHSGLHLLLRLPPRYPDQRIAEAARGHGIAAQPLSAFALQPLAQDNGLVLGYGNTPSERFDPLVRQLAALLDAVASG